MPDLAPSEHRPSEFDPTKVAGEVSGRLWRYLASNASRLDLQPVAEGLFRLPKGDLRRLTAAHLALSTATTEMLEAVHGVLRELPASVARAEVEATGAIRTPVNWPRTLQRQMTLGDKSRFVSRPPERAYDTALARTVLLALRRCQSLAHTSGFSPAGELGSDVTATASRAHHLASHAKLKEVTAVRRMPERALLSLRRATGADPIVRFVRLAGEALDDQSERVVKGVVRERLLSPSHARAFVLFELYVGFKVVDALVGRGFSEASPRLLPNKAIPFASLHRGPEVVKVWWQRPLWAALGADASPSRYRGVLDEARMRRSMLVPDFVLTFTDPPRVLFVEAKLTERPGHTPERDGIRDALAYVHDAEPLLEQYPEPHGLVVAWNATGRPGGGRLLVSDQGSVGAAMKRALASWREQTGGSTG